MLTLTNPSPMPNRDETWPTSRLLNAPATVSGVLLLTDLGILLGVWFPLTEAIAPRNALLGSSWPTLHTVFLWTCLCVWLASQGHYTNRGRLPTEISQVLVGVMSAALLEYSVRLNDFASQWSAVLPWIGVFFLLPLTRLGVKRVLFQMGPWRLGTAVIGPAPQCSAIAGLLTHDWYRGFEVRALIVADSNSRISPIERELDRLINLGVVRHVLVATGDGASKAAAAVAHSICRKRGLVLSMVPALIGDAVARLTIDRFFGNDLVMLREVNHLSSGQRAGAKRFFDVVASLALLTLLAPVMLIIAAIIRWDGGPAIYASERLGRGGKPFRALKFRTMVPDADGALRNLIDQDPQAGEEWKSGFKLRNDPRVTSVGRVLRKLSLDELPQLLNVIKGDMSLVGPRPLLPVEREAYGEAFKFYCQCVPGITGPWQVSGRNNLDYQRRIELNTWYAKNASVRTDLSILFRTLSVVFRGVGAV